jgi:hypothetical protein
MIFLQHERQDGTTCPGITLASRAAMSFVVEEEFNWFMTVPDAKLTKKTFQIKKYSILRQALFFLSL